jgi:hypothetical protein
MFDWRESAGSWPCRHVGKSGIIDLLRLSGRMWGMTRSRSQRARVADGAKRTGLRLSAVDLVGRHVRVIIAGGHPSAAAAKAATATIPIVFPHPGPLGDFDELIIAVTASKSGFATTALASRPR